MISFRVFWAKQVCETEKITLELDSGIRWLDSYRRKPLLSISNICKQRISDFLYYIGCCRQGNEVKIKIHSKSDVADVA